MVMQTVTAKGQMTLRREFLRHMGIGPGDRVDVKTAPGGEVSIRAVKPSGSIEDFFGSLAQPGGKVATIEEINEAIEAGWAGEVCE